MTGQVPAPIDEDAILAAMLCDAERLCATSDALLAGQYEHLHARVSALIEIRKCLQVGSAQTSPGRR